MPLGAQRNMPERDSKTYLRVTIAATLVLYFFAGLVIRLLWS